MTASSHFNDPAFLGAFIAASASLCFWLINSIIKIYIKKVNDLEYLEKMLVMGFNDAHELKHDINNFLNNNDNKIDTLINIINHYSQQNIAFIGTAYFPELFTFIFPKEIINIKVKSNFLANKILEIYILSNRLSKAILDASKQFHETLERSTAMNINKMNDPVTNNNSLVTSLMEYRTIISSQLNSGLDIYSKKLGFAVAKTKLMLKYRMLPWTLVNWTIKFKHTFKKGFDYEIILKKTVEDYYKLQ